MKKSRKPAPAKSARKPVAALPAPKKNALDVGPVVVKLGQSATEMKSLKLAQAVYIVGREESGMGASDLPSALIYQEGTQIARIAYNGRVFDAADNLMAEAIELETALRICKAEGTPLPPPAAPAAEVTDTSATEEAQPEADVDNGAQPEQQPEQQPEAVASAEAEQLAPATSVTIPAPLVAAALAIAPKVDKSRPQLAGVYLHQIDGAVRMAVTDGHRMLVLNVPAGENQVHPEHAWGKDGVILPAEALGRIARYVGKDEGAAIAVSYGVGHPHVGVTEVNGMARFAVQPIGGRFPDYQRVAEQAAGAFTTSREPTETNAVDADYLKSAGIVAAALGAPHVFPFTGADGQCTVFTFATVPGAVLYIMPVRVNSTSAGLQAETVRLIGAAGMAGTIAALKAHETRTRTSSNNVRLSKEERQKLVDKADSYARRIAEIQAACTPSLPAPAAATTGTGDDTDADGEGVNA